MRRAILVPAIVASALAWYLHADQAKPAPHTVVGVAVDAQGKPIAGATIWIKPSVTTGLVKAHTDEHGQYRMEGLVNVPYNTFAWARFNYRGKDLCLRLAPETIQQYDSFVPTSGVVRNFRLRTSGRIEDRGNIFYGGEARVFIRATEQYEFILEPNGPLADGSVGSTLTRTIGPAPNMFLTDVPVGSYRVSAKLITPGGQKPAFLSRTNFDQNLAPQVTLDFESKDSCIGSFGNGLDRAFIWVQATP